MSENNQAAHGAKWIRPEKRLALYARDGFACVLCGGRVNEVTKLTLDHVQPFVAGGSNEPSNLITACHDCNSRRQNSRLDAFAFSRFGSRAFAVLDRVAAAVKRPIDVETAKVHLRASDGVFTAALRRAHAAFLSPSHTHSLHTENPSDNDLSNRKTD